MASTRTMCIHCTRLLSRLNRLPIHTLPPTPRLFPRCIITLPLSQATTPRRLVHTRDTFAKTRFTLTDIPPLDFWASRARPPLVPPNLHGDELFHAAQTYAKAALEDIPGWRDRLVITTSPPSSSKSANGKTTPTLSAYTLHYVATILVINHMGASSHLATHILHTLITTVHYAPSILTLLRLAVSRQDLRQAQFQPAIEGLERILKRIDAGDKNIDFAADACTLRALMYMSEKTRESDTNALRWFRRAYEVDTAAAANRRTIPGSEVSTSTETSDTEAKEATTTFNPTWQWKPSFALSVGAINLRRGELSKARAMYELASSGELDTAAGYYGVAQVLAAEGDGRDGGRDSVAYAEALERAAVSGHTTAARGMADLESDRSQEPGLSEWEKRKRQVMAEEWMAVAGVTVPAEG